MRRALWVLDHIEEIVGGTFFVIIVITVFLGVLFRYLLNNPIPWTIELATIAFVWVVFLGASSAMKHQMHIGIDALTRLAPKPVQEVLGIAVNLGMLWLLWFFIYGGWTFSISAWMKITPVFKMPYTFVDLAVPVGSTLMAIRLVQQTVTRVRLLWRGTVVPRKQLHPETEM